MAAEVHLSVAVSRIARARSSTTPTLSALADLFASPDTSRVPFCSPFKHSVSQESLATLCSETDNGADYNIDNKDDDDEATTASGRSSCSEQSNTETPERGCWICWESTTAPGNELIRVCRDCKDCDLQLVHEECINRYIASLPMPSLNEMATFCAKHSHAGASESQLAHISREVAYKSKRLDGSLAKHLSVQDQVFMNFYYSQYTGVTRSIVKSDSSMTLVDTDDSEDVALLGVDALKEVEGKGTAEQAMELIPEVLRRRVSMSFKEWRKPVIIPGYSCNRCMNPYVVVSLAQSPFLRLLQEKFLLSCIIFMSLSIWMLTSSCVYLTLECPEFSKAPLNLLIVDVPTYALLILTNIVCHAVYFWTWLRVWRHCALRRELVVVGLNEKLVKHI